MIVADKEELLKVPEAAKLLRVSNETIRRMCDAGQLEARKVRGQWRILRRSLDKYFGSEGDD